MHVTQATKCIDTEGSRCAGPWSPKGVIPDIKRSQTGEVPGDTALLKENADVLEFTLDQMVRMACRCCTMILIILLLLGRRTMVMGCRFQVQRSISLITMLEAVKRLRYIPIDTDRIQKLAILSSDERAVGTA